MAKIDALLGHMTQRGATRALLQADAPATLETEAGTTQGAPLSGAQLQSMLDEIMPAAARQNLIDNGRADFTYTAPSGPFNVRVAQPNGKWHLEVQPATAPSATSPQTTIAPTIETVKTGAPAVNTARPGPPAFDPLGTNAPPPSPPVTAQQPAPYAPPPGQAGAAGANYQNNSGMGEASVLPAELQGFSWAGLFGSWIWGLGNNVWIGLLCLVPCLGFFMRFYLGARGNEMAWKSKQWESVQAFRSAQTLWGVLGGVATAGALVFLVIPAAIVFPVFARASENAKRSACQSNQKQLGLAVLQFSQDHNENFPTGTTMAQWKPQLMPYLKDEELFVCPSHTGAGESYKVNPALSGVNLATLAAPSQTPMFTETDADLHLDGSSATFADGHVKWYRNGKIATP